jgi:hypothetical protein
MNAAAHGTEGKEDGFRDLCHDAQRDRAQLAETISSHRQGKVGAASSAKNWVAKLLGPYRSTNKGVTRPFTCGVLPFARTTEEAQSAFLSLIVSSTSTRIRASASTWWFDRYRD